MESLLLFARALASPTMCRFIPTLSVLLFPSLATPVARLPPGLQFPAVRVHRTWFTFWAFPGSLVTLLSWV